MNAIVWLAGVQGSLSSCYCGVQSPFILPLIVPRSLLLVLVSTSLQVTSSRKPLLYGLPCKWQHINVGSWNL